MLPTSQLDENADAIGESIIATFPIGPTPDGGLQRHYPVSVADGYNLADVE